ncbi:MAG TPA: type III-B CRISPR module RAMP protein Cmr1 [Chthonomonas sp.]|uniref:type III-B CRISPR module RAMP protein Cmr1 n=1 Tax=Chthonomonas sp. TaxID=2282153 RepID=UPI002B4B1780|nr:type III-B CRISPR module RAMP protein Cmr1 [Chthonomonas sp.]HLI49726.1 type III-B CRISPR module RAMP protein Cmr1 [Chthonomonas sp.]
MRPIKSADPPTWPQTPSGAHQESLTLSLKLITPMFGGGYKAGEVDDVCRIRAATVRGHLRFWWRALYGAEYTTSNELFKAEKARWGSTEKPAAISLKVVVTSNGKSKTYSQWTRNNSALTYFLFPFQKNNQRPQEGEGYADIAFTLTLDFLTKYQDEVERTLKAWIAFGGIGARTRRGCGALTVTENAAKWCMPANPSERANWLKKLLPSVAEQRSSTDIPILLGARCVLGAANRDAVQVWEMLAQFWRNFRKGLVSASGSNTGRRNALYGKGLWQDFSRLSALLSNNALPLVKPFLGMPIIYQETPTLRNATQGFIGDLVPEGSERMASPLILKPIALSDGQFCPCVLVLSTGRPQKLKATGQLLDQNRRKSVDASVTVRMPTPSEEPLLRALGVSDVYAGVIEAAKKFFDKSSVYPL